uniref:Uncharacterized protein n=1 Tax=Anguilla anguilla TaxID=7936 RepID=A0A0E9R9Q5_ANGAN
MGKIILTPVIAVWFSFSYPEILLQSINLNSWIYTIEAQGLTLTLYILLTLAVSYRGI